MADSLAAHLTPSDLAPSDLALPARASALAARFQDVRAFTQSLCQPLAIEDHVIQSMPDVSPPKWHLAHTTWFFENFLLSDYADHFRPFHPEFHYLFNSYYKSAGRHFERTQRGLLSRPTVEEILKYRRAIDEQVLELLDSAAARGDQGRYQALESIVTLGLHHEQQHQELLVTDIKHILWSNPLRPAYVPGSAVRLKSESHSTRLLSFPEGIVQIGQIGQVRPIGQSGATLPDAFAFDNERPRHRVFLEPYGLHSSPVTCGEFLEFIEAGGYSNPLLWLSEGWEQIEKNGWEAPLYWEKHGERFQIFTLNGMRSLDEAEPVCHISYFEADAFARWRGLRLPTEAEWENAAGTEIPLWAQFAESRLFHPRATIPGFFGNVWEWTASPYMAYPGFKPLPSSLGEYNGKFMCNQFVLRGGSCATSETHIRPTYRNFFAPQTRYQFSGLRLAT